MNNPIKRNVDGILLLDKPKGITSNAALQIVKRLYCARKAGHSGSLDPIATGLLPVCFGEATKFSQFLLESDKHYLVTALLGVRTDSGDSEGKIISSELQRTIPKLTTPMIESVLDQFRGEITQIPSMYSAIKVNGQPLYKLARQGIEIERQGRLVNIYSLELISWENDLIQFDVKVSKGTYIRTLVDDLGEKLGCGAHVVSLRRIGAGPYQADQMIGLDQLQAIERGMNDLDQRFAELDSLLVPLKSSVSWPEVTLSEPAAYYLKKGQPVIVPYAPTEGFVKLLLKNNQFLGIGEILEDGRVAPRRLLAESSFA